MQSSNNIDPTDITHSEENMEKYGTISYQVAASILVETIRRQKKLFCRDKSSLTLLLNQCNQLSSQIYLHLASIKEILLILLE